MITVKYKGDLSKTKNFLTRGLKTDFRKILEKYGERGVAELTKATPKDTGKTSESWTYEIVDRFNSISIYWSNSNINDGVPIAIILQYGHGVNGGGFVNGIDYINPALKPIFNKIAKEAWKEITGK